MEELLCALRAPGDTPVPVPSWHYEEDEPRQADTMLLRDALTLCYDLRRALLLGHCWTCTFTHAGPLDRWQPHCMVLSDLFLLLKERSLHAGSRCPKPELLQVLLDGLQREAAPAQAAKAQANGHVIHANGSAFGDTGEQPSAATRVWCSPLCVRHWSLFGHHEHAVQAESFFHGVHAWTGHGCCLEQAEQLRSLIKAGPAAVEAYMEPRHLVDMLEDAAGTAAPPLDKVRRGARCGLHAKPLPCVSDSLLL